MNVMIIYVYITKSKYLQISINSGKIIINSEHIRRQNTKWILE